ncbi:MAG: hypothetical protein ABW169_07610 [Sphingobium sp.]
MASARLTMADWHVLIEEIRPWWNTAAITGLVAWAGRMWVRNRELRISENKDDRDGYGVLISTLQSAIKTMREEHSGAMSAMREEHSAEIAAMRAEHAKCEERLSKIEGELMGFHRQALVASQQGAALLPASTMVQEAGKRAVEASRIKE